MRSRALSASDFVPSLPEPERERSWGLSHIAGRLVELSGTGSAAQLTAAFGLVLDAQVRGEPAAWVTLPESSFYPPDAAEGSVDLSTLAVVRAPNNLAAARAAVQLTRSGAFGLVVVDFAMKHFDTRALGIPAPLQSRLIGLAQKHDTAIVVLTEKSSERPSLGSLVSLRAEIRREPLHRPTSFSHPVPAAYRIEIHVVKDKRRGPGTRHREICHGPAGLR